MKFSSSAVATVALAVMASSSSSVSFVEAQNTCDTAVDAKTIVDLVCGSPVHTTLCTLVGQFGAGSSPDLVTALSTGSWTLFAPVDSAFQTLLADPAVATAVQDPAFLSNVLTLHAIPGLVLQSDGLLCGSSYSMANNDDTFHFCTTDLSSPESTQNDLQFQVGRGNAGGTLPKLIVKNVLACNGVM